MKTPSKPYFLLLGLVLTVYLARQSDFSFAGTLKQSLRALEDAYPSRNFCTLDELEKSVSGAQRTKADGIKKDVQKMRNGNPLKEIVREGNYDDMLPDYVMPFIPFVGVWAAMFVLSLLCCFGIICNWCCMFGLCKACAPRCCKQPKTQAKKKLFLAVSGVALLGLACAAIAGLALSAGVPKGMKLTVCSFMLIIEDLSYGKPGDKWIGVQGAINSIDDILDQFSTTVSGLNPVNDAAINTAKTAADAAIDNLVSQNGNVQATSSEPTQQVQYKPDYINKLGPKTNTDTYSYALQKEIDVKKDAIDDAKGPLNTAINTVKSQSSSIESAINSGKGVARGILSSLQSVLDMLNDTGKTVNQGIKYVGIALTIIFAVNLVFALFSIISIVMVGVLKIKFFNKFLHLNCFFIMLWTVLGFILATIFYPLSIIMIESCDVIDATLNDRAYFRDAIGKYLDGDMGQAKDVLELCIFDDGNILGEIGIETQIGYFDTMFTSLDSFSNVINYDATSAPPSVVVPIQKTLVGKYKDGTIPDAAKTVDDLGRLNTVVNEDSNSCTNTIRDEWVLNSASCRSSVKKFADNSLATFDMPLKTCIGLDNWKTAGHNGADRYTTVNLPVSCATVRGMPANGYAADFVDNLKDNRNEITTIFGDVDTDLDTVSDKFDDFGDQVFAIMGQFKNVKTGLSGIKNSLVGTNGLITNTNCKFIKNDIQLLTDAMCVSFISSLYQSSVVIIASSVMSFLGAISVFCLAKRFTVADDKAISP